MMTNKRLIKITCLAVLPLTASFFLLNNAVQATELTTIQNPATADSSQSRQLVISAYKLIQSGDYSSAIPVLQKSLKLDPDNTNAHRYLSYSFFHTGLAARALEESRQVIEAGGDLAQDHFALAEAHFYVGKPELALKSYMSALQINPLYTPARIGVVRSLIALGKVEQAKLICQNAANNSPGFQSKSQFKKLLAEMNAHTQNCRQGDFKG